MGAGGTEAAVGPRYGLGMSRGPQLALGHFVRPRADQHLDVAADHLAQECAGVPVPAYLIAGAPGGSWLRRLLRFGGRGRTLPLLWRRWRALRLCWEHLAGSRRALRLHRLRPLSENAVRLK